MDNEYLHNCKPGTVYWITGLSGAGKTTIGKELFEYLRSKKGNVVMLDNDELKSVLGGVMGHSMEERKARGYAGSRMCKLFSEQGVDVVYCAISMFDAIRQWNRQNIENYKEIFLDVPMEVLASRDIKGIYEKKGRNENVVGVDLKAEFPKTPDIIIKNDGSVSLKEILEQLIRYLNI